MELRFNDPVYIIAVMLSGLEKGKGKVEKLQIKHSDLL